MGVIGSLPGVQVSLEPCNDKSNSNRPHLLLVSKSVQVCLGLAA